MKTFSGIMLFLLFVSTLTLASKIQPVKSSPTTITVPDDYPTIQEAIDAANEGDTIFVRAGVYYENIVVNKTIYLIGEDKSTTVIDGMQKGHVINVATNGVTITGFAITNSSLAPTDSGIYLYEINGCNITQNNIIDNNIGVFLEFASNNNISSNNITENSWCGIYLSYSSNNNLVSLNNLEANNWYGIGLLWSSATNDINGNNITKNYYGIGLGDGSSYNAISRNNIANNLIGVGLRDNSNDNIIIGNNIEASNQYGIYLYDASRNNFHYNNFSNSWQVYDASYMLPGVTPSTNIWDDGFPSGGNYWSDYVGVDVKSGPNQDLSGSDGIGDTPYVIDASNTDRYPLMNPHTPHDVAIMNVSPKTVVGLGYCLNVSVTAANQGDYPETCNVTVYANNTQIETQPVTVETGTFTTMTFTWNTTGFAKGNWTISAYAEPVLNETYVEDNNCTCNFAVHVGVPGDISGPAQCVYDGITNMRDISYLILLFTTKPSSPNWNPNADINNDATVNMRDISIAVLNFNKHE